MTVIEALCLAFAAAIGLAELLGYGAWAIQQKIVEAAKAEGRREAFREASALMRERAQVAMQLAPRGDLVLGSIRAQVYDTAALELRCRQ
jgi:hypothetical protein